MQEQVIRTTARQAGVPLWRLAEAMGTTDSGLSRQLRHEWPPEKRDKGLALIAEIKEAMRREADAAE